MRASDREHSWAVLIAYTALFGVFAWPWLRVANDTFPRSVFGHAIDERLVGYILAWVAHALATRPGTLFDMPINYPAPIQLTGSEHFLSTQLVFAPIFWLTGNAILAANLAVFVAYPLEAGAMYWLARRLGCDRVVAFVAGLALALGSAQLPAHLHRLQYLVLYLPLVAGMLTRLRLEPTARRTAALAGVCLLAFFSSYYACVVTMLVAALWALAELCRPGVGRWRFALLATLGMAIPAAVLGVFSLPYLMRPEAAWTAPTSTALTEDGFALLASVYSQSAGGLLRLLGVLGLIGLVGRASPARTAAARGLLCMVVGSLLMLGPGQTWYGVFVPLPYTLIQASPLHFFRYPFRFVGMVTFGRALLVAGGLQAVRQLLPTWLGNVIVVGTLAALVGTRAPLLAGDTLDTVAAVRDPVFDVVARVCAGGETGALLELPIVPAVAGKFLTEGETQIGQTRHWCPLVGGHTGYHPVHRGLVMQMIHRLPAPMAIQTLVDMTHVRWVLLRPSEQWPPTLRSQRDAIARAPWTSSIWAADGWTLLRVELQPADDVFFTAIARGWRPGLTALGTPVEPIPAAEARAVVSGQLPPTMVGNAGGGVRLTVQNAARTTWPVTVPRLVPSVWPEFSGAVYLQATWRREDATAAPVTFDLELPRDIRGGETVTDGYFLPTPAAGRYALEIAVRQRGDEAFASPASQPLRGHVVVR